MAARMTAFFESTELAEGDREVAGTDSEIIPGNWGKGKARLVGLPPLKRSRTGAWKRQHSPAPLAALARRQSCESGAWQQGAIRNRSELSQVIRVGFGSG